MKFAIRHIVTFSCAVFGAQLAIAAPLPKEGPTNLLLCLAGDAPPTMIFSKEHMLGTLAWSGALWNVTPGGPFDAMSGECGGHYSVSPTGVDSVGQCQYIDADGDKTLVNIPQNHNGTGIWTFVAGTGKYVGLSGSGEFKPLRQLPPALTQGKAVVCSTITGTYKIK
jgi:hypothetical protein